MFEPHQVFTKWHGHTGQELVARSVMFDNRRMIASKGLFGRTKLYVLTNETVVYEDGQLLCVGLNRVKRKWVLWYGQATVLESLVTT